MRAYRDGQYIDVPDPTPEQMAAAREKSVLRTAQAQAKVDQDWLKQQALDKLVSDAIAATPDLAAHQVAIDAVLSATPGTGIPVLPSRPTRP